MLIETFPSSVIVCFKFRTATPMERHCSQCFGSTHFTASMFAYRRIGSLRDVLLLISKASHSLHDQYDLTKRCISFNSICNDIHFYVTSNDARHLLLRHVAFGYLTISYFQTIQVYLQVIESSVSGRGGALRIGFTSVNPSSYADSLPSWLEEPLPGSELNKKPSIMFSFGRHGRGF